METLTNWWKSITGTSQDQQPVVETPSGMTDGVQGGRKKKTRRGGKKSRKTKPRRK
jgi:hypothetical protein